MRPLGTVLVVDDEPGIRQLARRILEGQGYTVVEAENGAEALAIVERGDQVDFLMTDLDMPVMRGDDMVTRIRAIRPELNVLYVTAYTDQLFKDRALLWEGEAFLDKPFTPTGLLEAVSLARWNTIDPPPPKTFSLRHLWDQVKNRSRRPPR